MALARSAVLDACRAFDAWLAFRQRYEQVPGVQAAVLHDGEVVLSTAHGLADVPAGTPLTTSHLFRIASHSKTFTATAVMQLVEQGRLRLDDPISTWVSELAGSPIASVTIRELAAHAGGVVRDGRVADHWQLIDPFPDTAGLLAMCADGGKVLDRNVQFKYSNVGYSLLGMAIERAGGAPYAQQVQERLLAPLGLADTSVDLDPARLGEIAVGHTARSYLDQRFPIEHIGTGAMASATGFTSTATDVVRWCAAHFHGDARVLSDASKREMQHTAWEVEGTGGSGYGLGFATASSGGRRLLGHGGGFPGHITRTFFDPVDRIAVSVLTNAIDGPALGLATGFVRLLELAVTAASRPDPEPAHAEVRAHLVGRYANLWGVSDLVDLGGRLHLIDPTQPDPGAAPTILDVVDDQTLAIASTTGYGSPGEQVTIELAADGSVAALHAAVSSWPVERLAGGVAGRQRIRLGAPIVDP